MSSIASQLTLIATALSTWAADLKGTCEIAQDPVHLFALLAARPGSFRACILFKDELKRGEHEEAGMVDRTYMIVLSRGKGFSLSPDSLVKGSAGGGSLADILESARQQVRAIKFSTLDTEGYPNYRSLQLFQVESSQPLDAYQIEFSIGCILDPITPELDQLADADDRILIDSTGDQLTDAPV